MIPVAAAATASAARMARSPAVFRILLEIAGMAIPSQNKLAKQLIE
ncbi:hypothetical protein CFter6_0199 [Collimonas fungivorans]|uniref:Uncharacterized protein n=1 Tax=Collimonas fungivorans TaxID=158899 RepID=A0A127P518_9BURK|nr:hypothetical protein CFter6_0199 [Collimonas fungivorans]